MKRMLLAACASSLLALAAPSLASAHHARCHGHHHACSHVRHAHHARVLKFGAAVSSTSPTSPSAPVGGETAGKVTTFEGGVLTITLNDGSTVSGKVTEQTEIRCQSATPTEGSDDDGGDESSGDGDASHSAPRLGSTGDDLSAGEDGGDDDGGQTSSCTSAALVPGTTVREAELSIGGGGAVWEHIDLIQ